MESLLYWVTLLLGIIKICLSGLHGALYEYFFRMGNKNQQVFARVVFIPFSCCPGYNRFRAESDL